MDWCDFDKPEAAAFDDAATTDDAIDVDRDGNMDPGSNLGGEASADVVVVVVAVAVEACSESSGAAAVVVFSFDLRPSASEDVDDEDSDNSAFVDVTDRVDKEAGVAAALACPKESTNVFWRRRVGCSRLVVVIEKA